VQYIKKARELYLLKVLEELQQKININIIGLLSKLKNKDTIVVIVDWFTKIIRLKVITIAVSSEKFTKIYQNKIWKLYKIPKSILSNKEPRFALKFIKDFTKALNIKRALLITYYL